MADEYLETPCGKKSGTDVVAITVTWLKPDDSDALFLCKTSHNIYRQDRKVGEHGGVALLVSKSFKSCPLTFDDVVELEYVCVAVVSKHERSIFCVVYKPSCTNHGHLIGDMERLLLNLDNLKCPYVLLGDFNLPDIQWNVPMCNSTRGKQNLFLSLFISFGLSQKVLEATRKQNTLDLVFESEPNIVSDVKIDCKLTDKCDHDIVRFSAVIHPPENNDNTYQDWNNADYEGMQAILDSFDWSSLFKNCLSTNDKWNCFKIVMKNLFCTFVPEKKPKRRSNNKKFPKEIQKLLSKKRLAFRKLRNSSPVSPDLEEKCNVLNKKCNDAILSFYERNERFVLENGSLKSFLGSSKRL